MTLDELKARCVEIGECWEWVSKRTKEHGRRYPQIRIKRKTYNARRYVYETAKGPIPEGLKVVPKCRNPYCVNPEHMAAMNEQQKTRMAAKAGAFSSLTRSRSIAEARRKVLSKIDMEKANEIRASDESGPVLAARYGIDKSLVNRIKRGDAWKDYSSPYAALLR